MNDDRPPAADGHPNKWLVLALLLAVFLAGDILGGVLANRLDLSNWGELAIEFGVFALVAAVMFRRTIR